MKQKFRVPHKGYNDSFNAIQNISGLVLALNYRYPNTLFADAAMTTPAEIGQGVGAWRNRATDAYHATQGTAANKPILTADGIQFDGTNDYLGVARMTGAFSAGFTWVMVARLSDGQPSSLRYVWGGFKDAQYFGYFLNFIETGGSLSPSIYYANVNYKTTVSTLPNGATSAFLWGATATPSSTFQGYYNGSAAGTPVTISGFAWANIAGEFQETPFFGCANFNGSPSTFAACTIRSLYIWGRPLTATELLAVHRNLGHTHGIAVP